MQGLNGLLINIGYDEKPEDNDLTKCLRQEAAKWMCFFRDSFCQEVAMNKLNNHLENPEKNKYVTLFKTNNGFSNNTFFYLMCAMSL